MSELKSKCCGADVELWVDTYEGMDGVCLECGKPCKAIERRVEGSGMKKLTVRGSNAAEIAASLGIIGNLLLSGYTSGTLLDGWDLSEED